MGTIFLKETFADDIYEARLENRSLMSLREVGKQVGVHFTTISRIMRGTTPDMPTFLALCDWMNQNPSKYFGDKDKDLN